VLRRWHSVSEAVQDSVDVIKVLHMKRVCHRCWDDFIPPIRVSKRVAALGWRYRLEKALQCGAFLVREER